LIEPSAAIVMKVGFHAGEEWNEIIARKQGEISSAGVTFWGYGGSACHPLRQVQPFAHQCEEDVVVAMLWTESRPLSPSRTAEEMSVDGEHWQPLPPAVRITGSKWALVLDQLNACEETVDLGVYEIGVGPSAGKLATAYLRGQSDKACVRRSAVRTRPDPRTVVACGQLAEPWAVFLR
jgi:hypothetical protein